MSYFDYFDWCILLLGLSSVVGLSVCIILSGQPLPEIITTYERQREGG